jgi:hypothetical protein
MLADRVGVAKGLLEDVARGHIPNIPGELGWRAEGQHNRKSLVTRVVVGTVLVGALVAYLTRDGEDR